MLTAKSSRHLSSDSPAPEILRCLCLMFLQNQSPRTSRRILKLKRWQATFYTTIPLHYSTVSSPRNKSHHTCWYIHPLTCQILGTLGHSLMQSWHSFVSVKDSSHLSSLPTSLCSAVIATLISSNSRSDVSFHAALVSFGSRTGGNVVVFLQTRP